MLKQNYQVEFKGRRWIVTCLMKSQAIHFCDRKMVTVLILIAIGVQWNTMWLLGDGYTMGHILIMLLVDSIIYSILTWYLDAVIPGEFGTPQSLYFPFTVSILVLLQYYSECGVIFVVCLN